VLFIAGTAALIVGVVSYLRPKPLLSADDPPDVILQKVVDAYGGRTTLDRWKSGRLQYEFRLDPPVAGPTFHYRDTFQIPGKLRREMTSSFAGDTITHLVVADGNNLWKKQGKEPTEKRPDDDLEAVSESCSKIVKWFHPAHVLGDGAKLTVVGTARGDDSRTDLVLKVRYNDEPEESECRIDVRTGLIREFTGPQQLPMRTEDVIVRSKYSEFKWTSGGLVPHRIVGTEDNFEVFEIRLLTIDLDTPVDPASFLPPPDAPRP
jgi:hypothetical protein